MAEGYKNIEVGTTKTNSGKLCQRNFPNRKQTDRHTHTHSETYLRYK